jgi:hypothetical protein
MSTNERQERRPWLVIAAAAASLLSGCAEGAPLAPALPAAGPAQFATLPAEANRVFATLRRATARYHDLDAAIADGFILLHPCEERPGEGPVGAVYFHPGRTMDGVLDPEAPDALVYEPSRNGRPKLVAVELVMPYALWTETEPPRFLGVSLQPEDEFGVFGLHVWVWRDNPEGIFAEANPRISCDAE